VIAVAVLAAVLAAQIAVLAVVERKPR